MSTSFLDETKSALRGVVALAVGDRRAPDYFDLSQRGLVGSFIALLSLLLIGIVLDMALGAVPPGAIGPAVLQMLIVYAGATLTPRLLLVALGRPDAFRPYLVAVNWANVASTPLMLLAGETILLIPLLIALFILSINIGRLMMTLKPMQIVMLFGAQLIGFLVALLLIIAIFPPSPEAIAAAQAAAAAAASGN